MTGEGRKHMTELTTHSLLVGKPDTTDTSFPQWNFDFASSNSECVSHYHVTLLYCIRSYLVLVEHHRQLARQRDYEARLIAGYGGSDNSGMGCSGGGGSIGFSSSTALDGCDLGYSYRQGQGGSQEVTDYGRDGTGTGTGQRTTRKTANDLISDPVLKGIMRRHPQVSLYVRIQLVRTYIVCCVGSTRVAPTYQPYK
jgi:hypothetical protein